MTLDVIKHHRWWFAISSTLVIISLISIFTKGFNFGMIILVVLLLKLYLINL